MGKIIFTIIFFCSSAASATGPMPTLGSIMTHRVHVYVPPEIAAGASQPELATRAGKMVADLNVMFAQQTIQRFTFDPADLTTTYWGDLWSDISPIQSTLRDFDIWIELTNTPGHSCMTFALDAGTAIYWHTNMLRDRDADTTPAGLDAYWLGVNTVAHELLHGFGGGAVEYYFLANAADTTGVAPIQPVMLTSDTTPTTPFWQEHSDYWRDPLLSNLEFGTTSIAERLTRVRFSELTVAIVNGLLRFNVQGALTLTPNLAQTSLRITQPNGTTPAAGASVLAWQRGIGSFGAMRQVFSGIADAGGNVTINWDPRAQSEPWLLIKASAGGLSMERWVATIDAEEAFILRGETQMNIGMALESTDRPTLSATSVTYQASEDTTLHITYESLLSQTDAADPLGRPISFRVDRITGGSLRRNGAFVLPRVTLVSAGDSLDWTPPADRAVADYPVVILRAHNGSSSSLNTLTVKATIAASPDVPVARSLSLQTNEDSVVTAALGMNDPDGTQPSALLVAPPTHGTVTFMPSLNDVFVSYSPDPDYHGTDSFAYRAVTAGGQSLIKNVPISIASKPDLPRMNQGTVNFSSNEDTFFAIRPSALLSALLARSPDGYLLDLEVVSVGPGTLVLNSVPVKAGDRFFVLENSDFRWTPPTHATGQTSVLTFRARDTNGSSLEVGQLIVDLQPINDPPTFDLQPTATMPEDSALCVYLNNFGAGGGEDESGQPLSMTVVSSNAALLPAAPPYVYVSGTGTTRCLNVVPKANLSGAARITVQVSDGAGGTLARSVEVTVNAVNDAPTYVTGSGTFSSDRYNHWAPLLSTLQVTDVDPYDTVSCAFTGSLPQNVEITTSSGSHTSVTLNAYYPIATFRSFWIVKHSIFSGGTETHTFRCKDSTGAMTPQIAFTVVAN